MAVIKLFIVLFSFLCTNYWLSLCHARALNNTIKPGQALRLSEKMLVSANGRFRLGSFNFSSSKVFLGIRYNDKNVDDVVWVANRDTPINGLNGTLTIDATDGVLKIASGGGNIIQLNPNQTAPNSTATLEDSGNLVVKASNSERVLWESFDYPTNVLLPGMKLGQNLTTGKKWILNSWLSETNPGTGPFTLEYNHSAYDDTGEILVVKRRGNVFFGYDPAMMGYWGEDQYSYIADEREIYFSYSPRANAYLRMWLAPNGRVPQFDLNHGVELIADCNGGVHFPSKCAELGSPACRSREAEFVQHTGRFLHEPAYSDNNSSIVLSDCLDRCWNNCSCIGFNPFNSDQTGCSFWSEGARFDESPGRYFYLLHSSNSNSNSKFCHGGMQWWIWVIICAVPLWF